MAFLRYTFDGADETTLLGDMIDRLQAAQPDWDANEADPVTRLFVAAAGVLAERLAVAETVPLEIWRFFGATFADTPPIDGEPATATATVTLSDSDGHIILAGTRASQNVNGVDHVFATTADVTVDTGQNTATVTFQAEEDGTQANGIAGTLAVVETLSFIDTITLDAATSGGVDAETDDAYDDRLAARMTLLTPRPILPGDYEVLARDTEGVARAMAVDGLHPGVDEVQSVTVTGATGGTFTLTYSGQTTAGIAHDADAAAVQAALEALSNIAVGDVACAGGPLGTAAVTITFQGALAKTDVAEMTADSGALTGGGVAAVTTDVAGVAPTTGNDKTIAISAVDSDGATIDAATQTALLAALEAEREVNFDVRWLEPTRTVVDVVCQIVADSTADPTTLDDVVADAIADYLSPANFAGGDASPPVWTGEDAVDYLAVVGVAAKVEGAAKVESLTLNGSPADVALPGEAPLPTVGTVTVTVI